MATVALQKRKTGQIRTRNVGRITALWAAIVLAVLTWQAVTYRGLVARAAEWEYARIGTYFPVATVLWLTALFTLPLVLLLGIRVRRRERRLTEADRGAAFALGNARAVQKLLIGLTVAPLIVAAVLAGVAIDIRGGTPRTVVLGGNGGVEGPVRIRGVLRLNRLAVARPSLVMPQAPVYYAPLTVDGAAAPTLQYFAQVPQTAPAAATPTELQGIAVKNGVPGPIRQLYLDAGYRLADPVYAVYPDVATARRPYLENLPMLLVAALVFGITAGIHRRTVRRLSREARSA